MYFKLVFKTIIINKNKNYKKLRKTIRSNFNAQGNIAIYGIYKYQ